MGFEPMLRYKRTTPLAGEPLEPLGYFSIVLKSYYFYLLGLEVFRLPILDNRKQLLLWFCSLAYVNILFAICQSIF